MSAPHWALIPFRPWTVAEVAANLSVTRAMNIGGISLILLVALPVGALAPSAAEPFADMNDYVADVLTMGPLIGIVGGAISLLPVWVPFFLVADLARKPSRPWRARAMSRVLLINHLGLFVPVLLLLPFLAMAPVASRSFGLGTEKPAWILEPWVQYAVSPLVPAGILLAWAGSLGLAAWRLRRMVEPVDGASAPPPHERTLD